MWPWKWGQGHLIRTRSSFCSGASVYCIWWGYITYFLRWNMVSAQYVVALIDLCDLENAVKVTWFKLHLCFALMHQCTKFGEKTSNISSDTKTMFHVVDLCDLENEVKVTQFELFAVSWYVKYSWDIERKLSFTCRLTSYPGASVYQIWWGQTKYFSIYWAETILHMPTRTR